MPFLRAGGEVGKMKSEEIKKLREGLLYLADVLVFAERMKKATSCNDCGKKAECLYRPDWGEQVRYNCILWEKAKDQP